MRKYSAYLSVVSFLLPTISFADDITAVASEDTIIMTAYYVSAIGFLIATILMGRAVAAFGKSALASIFSYLFIGTGIFFVIAIFQKLGGDFFGISSESMDFWWHIMFYLALLYYYVGLSYLVGLGDADTTSGKGVQIGMEKVWGAVAIAILITIFIIPRMVDSYVGLYMNSVLADLGLHHFIAFAIAGTVGYYLVNAKRRLGQIGRAIANPMIIAIFALGLQHFWELLNESWKVVNVTSSVGEGIEKVFLIIAALCIGYAALRLRKFTGA